MVLIFIVVAIPIAFICHIIFRKKAQGNSYKNKTSKNITKEVIEKIIIEWIAANEKEIKSSQIIQNEDGSSSITIEPHSQQAATIIFDIKWQMALMTITIGKYIIGFDNNDEDFNEINETILKQLLAAYKDGNYYIKDSYLNNELLESHLYFMLDNDIEITGISYGVKFARQRIAQHQTFKFHPLAK